MKREVKACMSVIYPLTTSCFGVQRILSVHARCIPFPSRRRRRVLVHSVSVKLTVQMSAATKPANASKKAIDDVWKACADISGAALDSQPAADTSFFDMGLDSLGLAELVIQLEEVYGEGVITIDDILAAPTLREVASLLPGGLEAAAAPAKAAPKVVVSNKPAVVNKSTPKSVPAMLKPATPAPKPTPAAPKPTPVASTPRTPANGNAALIIERLAKLENESRELRELVGSLAAGTPVPMAPMSPAAPENDDITDVTSGLEEEEGCEAPAPSVEDQWIRTTHVGSLPRASKGQSSDITEIVRMQLACGLDIINDGEWSRDNYVSTHLAPTSPSSPDLAPTCTHPSPHPLRGAN